MDLWQRRRALGERVLQQNKLYLDLRFWNDFCDAELGERVNTRTHECLASLRSAVARGNVICPVEYHVFSELNKQRRSDKRIATTVLLDELSAKTVLVSQFERVFLEILRFSQAVIVGREWKDPPRTEMWTRPMYFTGHVLPDLPATGLPPDLERRLREEFDHDIWNFGFTDVLKLGGPFEVGVDEKAVTAELLNRAKADATTQLSSFAATYRSEVLGSLDGYKAQLGQVGLYLFRKAGGDLNTVTQQQVADAAQKLRNLIYAAFQKRNLKGPLPTIHVGATLYSRLQWDRKRPYRSNDIFDFGHAEAALPYCNAFATEASLATLIKSSGLDKEYGCAVLTDTEAIMQWLDDLPAAAAQDVRCVQT